MVAKKVNLVVSNDSKQESLMKKRILASLLLILFVVGLFPMGASALGEGEIAKKRRETLQEKLDKLFDELPADGSREEEIKKEVESILKLGVDLKELSECVTKVSEESTDLAETEEPSESDSTDLESALECLTSDNPVFEWAKNSLEKAIARVNAVEAKPFSVDDDTVVTAELFGDEQEVTAARIKLRVIGSNWKAHLDELQKIVDESSSISSASHEAIAVFNALQEALLALASSVASTYPWFAAAKYEALAKVMDIEAIRKGLGDLRSAADDKKSEVERVREADEKLYENFKGNLKTFFQIDLDDNF